MDGLEARLLRAVAESQSPVESDAFAESAGVEHAAVVGLMKSLLTCDMIAVEVSRPTPARVVVAAVCADYPLRSCIAVFVPSASQLC